MIRKLTEKSFLKQIADIDIEASQRHGVKPWGFQGFINEFETKNSSIYIIEKKLSAEEEQDHFIKVFGVLREIDSGYHLIRIATASSYLQKGFAFELLSFFCDKALQEHKALWLEVRKDNIPALRLYKKKGFQEIRIISAYYDDGTDAVEMVFLPK